MTIKFLVEQLRKIALRHGDDLEVKVYSEAGEVESIGVVMYKDSENYVELV